MQNTFFSLSFFTWFSLAFSRHSLWMACWTLGMLLRMEAKSTRAWVARIPALTEGSAPAMCAVFTNIVLTVTVLVLKLVQPQQSWAVFWEVCLFFGRLWVSSPCGHLGPCFMLMPLLCWASERNYWEEAAQEDPEISPACSPHRRTKHSWQLLGSESWASPWGRPLPVS